MCVGVGARVRIDSEAQLVVQPYSLYIDLHVLSEHAVFCATSEREKANETDIRSRASAEGDGLASSRPRRAQGRASKASNFACGHNYLQLLNIGASLVDLFGGTVSLSFYAQAVRCCVPPMDTGSAS